MCRVHKKDFSISQAAHIQTAHKMTPTTPQTTHPQILTTNIVHIRWFWQPFKLLVIISWPCIHSADMEVLTTSEAACPPMQCNFSCLPTACPSRIAISYVNGECLTKISKCRTIWKFPDCCDVIRWKEH